jgi:hypothetical protein
MKEFAVGTQYVIDGKVRKVTKVNSKSVYFGRVRSDIQVDEQRGAQFIDVNGCIYYADDSYNPEQDAATVNSEETTTEIKEETIMTETMTNAVETTEVENETQTSTDIIDAVETHEEAAEKAPKYTEYVVMKADQKDTTLWWDIVRKQKGENISDIINPLHEEDSPKFVALVAVDKVKKYLDDLTIKGMAQTVRDVTKKYAKVAGIDNPTAGQVAEVFATIIEAFGDGARKGSWNTTPAAPAEEITEEDAE